MKELRDDIINKLAYFDIFSYPLTKEELYSYLCVACSDDEKNRALDHLLSVEKIFRLDEFYSLRPEMELATRRRKGNRMADEQLKIARRVARWLSWFPYVRGIAVSGSLSKNFADENSDIDFFVITAPGRLWIARSFMHFFKKLAFLVGRQHWLCMNYYVDEHALEIREKNIFTAIEILTVLPLRGRKIFDRFMSANTWIGKHFNATDIRMAHSKETGNNFVKILVEKIFNNRFGEKLDRYLMTVTTRRWKRKTEEQRKNIRGILMSMDAGRHYAKPDPKHFQDKIVERYRLKLEALTRIAAVTV